MDEGLVKGRYYGAFALRMQLVPEQGLSSPRQREALAKIKQHMEFSPRSLAARDDGSSSSIGKNHGGQPSAKPRCAPPSARYPPSMQNKSRRSYNPLDPDPIPGPLLPCPFCGTPNPQSRVHQLHSASPGTWIAQVECTKCGGSQYAEIHAETEIEAITIVTASWNRRSK